MQVTDPDAVGGPDSPRALLRDIINLQVANVAVIKRHIYVTWTLGQLDFTFFPISSTSSRCLTTHYLKNNQALYLR